MTNPPLVAVEATEPRYRVLTHYPSGIGLDGDGKGRWPADSFLTRLIQDGAIRLAKPSEETAPDAPRPGKSR
jgi:hypothetical protein